MGVYIKGMEMPKSCFYCPFRRKVDPDNIICIVTRELFEETFAGTIETRNRGNCPLVPVPEHGDLKDADAVGDFLRNKYWNSPWVRSHILDKIVRDIKGFQTIIPADPPVMYYPQVNGITPTVISDKEGER